MFEYVSQAIHIYESRHRLSIYCLLSVTLFLQLNESNRTEFMIAPEGIRSFPTCCSIYDVYILCPLHHIYHILSLNRSERAEQSTKKKDEF